MVRMLVGISYHISYMSILHAGRGSLILSPVFLWGKWVHVGVGGGWGGLRGHVGVGGGGLLGKWHNSQSLTLMNNTINY